ncbi:MAG: AAA family ATPase [Polyangiaceae bacterium]
MRIERLSLDPFGSFSNRHVVFRVDRRFHLVLGDNEAGKSTTLRALMALLYGMGEFARDVEGNAKARLEGTFLTDSGKRVSFVRTKKARKDEAKTPAGIVLTEAELDDLRGGVDLETFRSAHGLTLSALQEGSREMLAAKDDVGASLLAARFGGLDIWGAIESLESEQKEIYATSRRKEPRKLTRALELYKEAKAAAEVATSSPQSLEAQRKGLASAEAEVERLRSEFESVKTTLSRTRAIVKSADRLALRKRLSLEADELSKQVLVSPEDSSRLLSALEALDQGSAERASLEAEREQTERELARIPPPSPILEFRSEIEALANAADQDRRDEMELVDIAARQRELGESNLGPVAQDLAQGPEDIAKLLDLADAIVHVVQTTTTKQELALRDIEEAEEALERASRDLPQTARIDAGAVTEVLRQLEKSITAEESAKLAETKHRTRLEGRLREKTRPADVAEEGFVAFARLLPPLASIETTYVAIERARERVSQLTLDRARLDEEAEEIALRMAQAPGTRLRAEEDLIRARSERDLLLEKLRGTPSSAEALAVVSKAIEAADAIADELRTHAAEVSARKHLDQTAASIATKIDRCDRETARLAEERRRLEASLVALYPPACAQQLPETLREWARWGDEVRPLADAHEESVATRNHHAEERSSIERTLAQLLGGRVASSVLAQEARRALDEEKERTSIHERVQHRIASLEASRSAKTKELVSLASERKKASEKWAALASAHGLPADEVEGRNVIATALKARETVARRERLMEDRRRIEERRATFRDRLVRVVHSVEGDGATLTIHDLLAKLAAATVAFDARLALTRTLERADLERAARQRAVAWAESDVAAARERLGVSHPSDVRDIAMRSKQFHEIEVELRVLAGELAHLGDVSEEDVLRAEAEVPRLTNLFEALNEELQKAERHASSVRLGIESLEEVKEGASEALALAEMHLADARAAAREWTVSAVASRMLRDAMARLRSEAEGPIFEKASAFLRQMTGERYVALRVDLTAGKSQAIAVETKAGETVPLDRLSDGTRDQVYLAVRLAFLVLQRENGGPEIPLVLDDVLTAFDDKRARATLSLLLALSDRVEIIYFSHHARILELLAEAVPGGDLEGHVDVLHLGTDVRAAVV